MQPQQFLCIVHAASSTRFALTSASAATAPRWYSLSLRLVQGQINLRDAVRRDCTFTDPKSGKRYQLGSKLATLLVRAEHCYDVSESESLPCQ